jgi:hypothetical protein
LSAVRTSTCSGSAIIAAPGRKTPRKLTQRAQRHREYGEEKKDEIGKSYALLKSPRGNAFLRGA